MPGNRGGGRTPSQVKELAAGKLPRHIETLDGIATGISYVTMREKCPKCGHEDAKTDLALPVQVKPGEQVRAVEALAKLADPKELVITNDRAGAFFDCVYTAIVERVGETHAQMIQARAIQLMGNAA
jgi:Zn ribbon nucleic-acid-binding protein